MGFRCLNCLQFASGNPEEGLYAQFVAKAKFNELMNCYQIDYLQAETLDDLFKQYAKEKQNGR